MRMSELFGLKWSDVTYNEGLLGVRGKAKGRKDALCSNASRACGRVAAIHASAR